MNIIREKGIALGALFMVYPIICLVLYIAWINTPEKQEFLGSEFDNSMTKGLMGWIYEHFVSAPTIVICVLASILLFYFVSRRSY
ncbi:hypothetical protein V2U94_05720 [Paenibacillus polymyxa]|uniref:hypothetical protein n=1 Tax=Paenibacillus TaxID=44249 RepID=UPI001C243586|nr:hypothetical protein [Paenibacillus sp. AK121]MEE4567125.1 hypothetical protein [Paenibacillus polymyxa]